MEKVDKLAGLIRLHKHNYYKGSPIISDAGYDALEAEMKELQPDHPVLAEVGSEVLTPGSEVPHATLMGSLESTQEVAELVTWYNTYAKGCDLVLSPKVDGAAASLLYVDGRLIRAATRGNGTIGQDITANILAAPDIPNELRTAFTGEIRGEVFIRKSVFEYVNNSLPDKKKLKNPRNAAAGAIKAHHQERVRQLSPGFLAYDILQEFKEELDKETLAKQLGVTYVPLSRIAVDTLSHKQVADTFQTWTSHWENIVRPQFDFDIDGMVFSINDCTIQPMCGIKSKKYPNWKKVFKFTAESKATTILEVILQVGRTGKLTPVGITEPVMLAGTEVDRVTLHNWHGVMSKQVQPGSRIMMHKANDIIPKLGEVLSNPDTDWRDAMESLGAECPSCGTVPEFTGVELYCGNYLCPGQSATWIENYLKVLGIKGTGSKTLDILVAEDLIKSPWDLYDLTVESMHPHIKGARARNLLEGLHSRRSAPLATFLQALGVPSMGKSASVTVAEHFCSLDEVLHASVMDLKRLDDIGPATATNIATHLDKLSDGIKHIVGHGYLIVEPFVQIQGSMTGVIVCITGALSESKESYFKQVEALGGKYTSSVGKRVDYLVAEDPTGTSTKLKRARTLGIDIIDEAEFQARLKA